MQLFVHQRKELVGGAAVTAVHSVKNLGQLTHNMALLPAVELKRLLSGALQTMVVPRAPLRCESTTWSAIESYDHPWEGDQ